jgi:DNA-binding MarR family transcriptional regulator
LTRARPGGTLSAEPWIKDMLANTNDAPPNGFYDDPANSLGYLTRIAFRSFYRSLERRTLALGVSSGQWPFLRVLWNEEGMTQRELSRRVGMQEPTTVTALNSLARAGLVRREPSTEDRRKIHVFLTPKGRHLREQMMVCVAEVNEIAAQGIEPEDMNTLRRVLAKLSENLARDGYDGASAASAA